MTVDEYGHSGATENGEKIGDWRKGMAEKRHVEAGSSGAERVIAETAGDESVKKKTRMRVVHMVLDSFENAELQPWTWVVVSRCPGLKRRQLTQLLTKV